MSYAGLTNKSNEVLFFYSEWNKENYSDEKYGYYVGDEIFDTFEEAYDYYKSFDD